jgi:hypothetical protein
MSTICRERSVRARFRDEGRAQIIRITPKQARRLKILADLGMSPRVAVDPATGAVTAILGESRPSLEQVLERFRLVVDPAPFDPFVPDQWVDLIEKWTAPAGRTRKLLLYGSEGTGKDTLLRLLIDRLKELHNPDNTEILTLPSEESDRFVGHMETKGRELVAAIEFAKDAGRIVALYLPEIERFFATGDYTSSWQRQWAATLRDLLDGTRRLRADYVLATANYLSRLGGPVTSRFEKQHVDMNPELAHGILRAHWQSQDTDGLSSHYVLERLYREPIAEVTLASRNKITLKATDLTAFNGRFLTDLAVDLGERARIRRRKEPLFFADEAFADEILIDHLQAILAPVAEAAGSRTMREFLVNQLDPLDPPMAVRAALEGFAASKFVAC